MKYVFRKKRWSLVASAIDVAGSPLKLTTRRGPKLRDFKTALVVRLDHLGDVLLVTGVPKLLKESFGCRVIFLVSSSAAPLLENNPFVDEIVRYDAPWFARGPVRRRPLAVVARQLRAKNVDLAVAPRGDLRENFLLWLSGIPRRVGYGVTGGGFFLTDEADYPHAAHESARAAALFAQLGVRAPLPKPALYFTDTERAAFREKLSAWGLGREPFVVFQSAAGTPAKSWPESHAERFLSLFAERFPGARAVLAAGAAPAAECRAASDVVDLRGKTTLRELALLGEACAAFVGPDSGPTHLAAAAGAPTVFLYSGTNCVEEWGPLSESARVLRHPVPCSPCALTRCPVPGHPCMSGIGPEDAIRELEEIAGKKGRQWYTRIS